MAAKVDVGGQAVIEGVMMRSPRSFAVVCRRPNGEIVIKEDAWRPLWGGVSFLRWPIFRGGIVLVESLLNGFTALSFAARQQTVTAARSLGAAAPPSEPELSRAASFMMVVVSLAFGLALFVGAPHLTAWAIGSLLGYDATSLWFHVVDGAIKVCLLVGYLAAIGLMPDVRRVFQYHGAEHKSIFTYEKGLPLTVESARAQSRFHPRCGTSFLFIVITVSIVVFAAALRGRLSDVTVVDHALKILLKLPLMLPIAGIAYELLKLSGKHVETSRLARALAAPGMWLQKITTREPSDDQLEIALISIRKTLWRERQPDDAVRPTDVEVYASAAEIDLPLA